MQMTDRVSDQINWKYIS